MCVKLCKMRLVVNVQPPDPAALGFNRGRLDQSSAKAFSTVSRIDGWIQEKAVNTSI